MSALQLIRPGSGRRRRRKPCGDALGLRPGVGDLPGRSRSRSWRVFSSFSTRERVQLRAGAARSPARSVFVPVQGLDVLHEPRRRARLGLGRRLLLLGVVPRLRWAFCASSWVAICPSSSCKCVACSWLYQLLQLPALICPLPAGEVPPELLQAFLAHAVLVPLPCLSQLMLRRRTGPWVSCITRSAALSLTAACSLPRAWVSTALQAAGFLLAWPRCSLGIGGAFLLQGLRTLRRPAGQWPPGSWLLGLAGAASMRPPGAPRSSLQGAFQALGFPLATAISSWWACSTASATWAFRLSLACWRSFTVSRRRLSSALSLFNGTGKLLDLPLPAQEAESSSTARNRRSWSRRSCITSPCRVTRRKAWFARPHDGNARVQVLRRSPCGPAGFPQCPGRRARTAPARWPRPGSRAGCSGLPLPVVEQLRSRTVVMGRKVARPSAVLPQVFNQAVLAVSSSVGDDVLHGRRPGPCRWRSRSAVGTCEQLGQHAHARPRMPRLHGQRPWHVSHDWYDSPRIPAASPPCTFSRLMADLQLRRSFSWALWRSGVQLAHRRRPVPAGRGAVGLDQLVPAGPWPAPAAPWAAWAADCLLLQALGHLLVLVERSSL